MTQPTSAQTFPAPGLDGSTYGSGQIPVWNPNLFGAGVGGWQPGSNAAGASLDTTGTDIAPLGTQAAGAIGKAADAGHVHAMPRLDQIALPTGAVALNAQKITGLANGVASSDAATVGQLTASNATRLDYRIAAMGMKGQNWDLYEAYIAGAALTSQNVYYSLCGFFAGDLVTNIIVSTGTAGAGTAPTAIYLGIYTAALALVASTANLASSGIWTATPGFAVAPLSTPYTVPSAGGYYLAILVNGAFATTPMQLMHNNIVQNNLEAKIGSSAVMTGYQTAQTTLPSTAAITSYTTTNQWFGWS